MALSTLGRCCLVSGSDAAGILLYHFHDWRKRRKTAVLVRSRAELAEDTGFSLHKIERALATLERKGLIEREQHLVEDRNILHTRLTDRALEALSAGGGS